MSLPISETLNPQYLCLSARRTPATERMIAPPKSDPAVSPGVAGSPGSPDRGLDSRFVEVGESGQLPACGRIDGFQHPCESWQDLSCGPPNGETEHPPPHCLAHDHA